MDVVGMALLVRTSAKDTRCRDEGSTPISNLSDLFGHYFRVVLFSADRKRGQRKGATSKNVKKCQKYQGFVNRGFQTVEIAGWAEVKLR